jgi:hypothetical protein
VFVPTTVYVFNNAVPGLLGLTIGLTVTVAPFKFPGVQLYVVAPDAVSDTGEPVQTLVKLEVAATTGVGLTTKVATFDVTDPGQVPVTTDAITR